MKKLITLAVFIVTFSVLAIFNVSAASASASLNGNSTLRSGDTLTLTLKFSASDMYGVQGTVSYDPTKLEFSSASCSNTTANFNYNDASKTFTSFGTSVITSSDTFKFTFKVKTSLAAGTNITVKFENIKVAIGMLETVRESVSTQTYSKAIAAPISNDATLSSLKITNATGGAAVTLNPSFNKNNTSYTANVPFEVSKINVSANATDSKAKVEYTKSYTLKENSTTTINIKVTAESGATKTYTVKVTRPKDPNYVPSGNANLSSLTVTGQTLSPAFSPSVTAYTVDVPFQVSSVKVTAKAQDGKAKVSVSGGSSLVAGQDNKITVTCTAENGTKKVYTIIVKRAEGSGETMPPVDTDTTVPPVDDPITDGSVNITDELTGITCTIPADKAPADAIFTVQEFTNGEVYDAYSKAAPEGAFKVYNMLMFASGYEIQPSGSVKITFPAVDGMDSEKAHMYTYQNGELVEVPFTSVDGSYVWETHRLGTVAIFSSAVEEAGDDTTVDTETQDSETTADTQTDDESDKGGLGIGAVIGIAAAALVLGAGATFAIMTIKSKKE